MSSRIFVFSFISIYLFAHATSVFSRQHQQEVCTRSEEIFSRSTVDYPDFIGRYTFSTAPIKALQCKSEEALATLEKAVPVVLKNCHFGDITKSWTTEYLKENLLSPNLTAYISPSRRFLFYNDDIKKGNYTWKPPHKRTSLNFTDFLHVMDELDKAQNGSKAYLQTSLEKELVHSDMQDDIFMFNNLWLKQLTKRLAWGPPDVNLFLVGMGGVVTPAHYDIMENLFLQIYGKKRCILFSPESYRYLYPFPLHHPHDRQTQVNFDYPDFEMFPKFRNITGIDAVLEPGDVLYIPNYWWHYIESEKNSKTISMNFWYLPKGDPEVGFADSEDMGIHHGGKQEKRNEDERVIQEEKEKDAERERNGLLEEEPDVGAKNSTEHVPLRAGELIGLSREIEEMIGNAIGDTTKVGEFLKVMTDGRYDFV